MKRTKPPPLATWMLEYCTSGARDEALVGDLCESYTAGHSDGWYWRQALSACAVSWSESLRARIPLLVFALIWSMMAPAWKVFTDGIESAPAIGRIWLSFGPAWALPALAGWVLLNSIFLWVGILVFILSCTDFTKTLHGNMFVPSLKLAPLVFAPVYGITFVVVNLYWYPYFANARLAATPLGQMVDLRMLANGMRIPYFVALLCALWRAVPHSIRTSHLLLPDSTPVESPANCDSLELASTQDQYDVKRFFGLMVGAGLINAMLICILLCRLPAVHSSSLSTLVVRAILHIVIGVVAGIGGSWIYWKNPLSLFRERAPIPFPLFALVCASGWIWVPSMTIFSEQLSPATAIVAAIGAVFLAFGLRHATRSIFVPAVIDSASYALEDTELFSDSLYRAPWDGYGYAIALLLYAGAFALFTRWNLTAAALSALCVFIFTWKQTLASSQDFDSRREYKRAALRFALILIPAVLLTIWALLDGVAHSNRVAAMNTALAGRNGTSTGSPAQLKAKSQFSGGGYESLILWPIPAKKQIALPLAEESLLAPGTTRPLIVPFNGPYWYIQPSNRIPGRKAHQAHGTPLGREVVSINSMPLVMEAHQTLGATIRTARCSEIQVEIENRDNKAGVIMMAVLLAEGAAKKQVFYLGQQPIVSTQPEHFSFKSEPVFETIHFSIPVNPKIRRFDEITVMMLPDAEHALVGPRIVIKQFQLLPR